MSLPPYLTCKIVPCTMHLTGGLNHICKSSAKNSWSMQCLSHELGKHGNRYWMGQYDACIASNAQCLEYFLELVKAPESFTYWGFLRHDCCREHAFGNTDPVLPSLWWNGMWLLREVSCLADVSWFLPRDRLEDGPLELKANKKLLRKLELNCWIMQQ